MELALLVVAGFLTGLINAVAGGSGPVQIPALFSAYPNIAPATLIGTNKIVSISGIATAAVRYGRTARIYWGATAPAVVTAFVFPLLGARALTHISAELLCRTLPFVLVALLAYTVARKNLGADRAPSPKGWCELTVTLLAGAVIGFYDSVFGPDIGSFLTIVFVRVLGYDLLHASALTKIVNLATSVAALLLLAVKGYVRWQLSLVMTVANVAGDQVGSHLALWHGSRFVCKVFIVIVLALVLKTAYDTFIR